MPHVVVQPTDEPSGLAGARPAADPAESEVPPPTGEDASPPDMKTERALLLAELRRLRTSKPEKFAGTLSANDIAESEIKGMDVAQLNDLVEAI